MGTWCMCVGSHGHMVRAGGVTWSHGACVWGHMVHVCCVWAGGRVGPGHPLFYSASAPCPCFTRLMPPPPPSPRQPVRPAYLDVEYGEGPEAQQLLTAWQQGRTGYPLVDAGEATHVWMQDAGQAPSMGDQSKSS